MTEQMKQTSNILVQKWHWVLPPAPDRQTDVHTVSTYRVSTYQNKY